MILLATTLKPSKMTYKDFKSSVPIFHHDISYLFIHIWLYEVNIVLKTIELLQF